MPARRHIATVPRRSSRGSPTRLNAAERALQAHRRVVAALRRIAALALSEQPLQTILHEVAQEVSAATGFPIVAIEFYEPATQDMELAAATGIPFPAGQTTLRIPVDQTLSGLVAQKRQPRVVAHAQERPEDPEGILRRLGVQTFVCLPLLVAEQVIGTLSLAHPEAVLLAPDLIPLAQSLTSVIATVVAHHRAVTCLQAAQTKYHTLFDSIPLGITVSDATGRIVETNATAEQLLGLGQAEQRQRQIDGAEWHIIRPDGSLMPSEEYASVRALREQHLVEHVEMGVMTPHGATAWINVTAAPLRLENGGVVIIYDDITARRQAEAALRESERSLQHFLDNSPDTIYVLDLVAHTSRFLNRETFLGYSRRELEYDASLMAAVHPDDRPAVSAQWLQLTTMTARQLPSICYRVQSRQGDWEWLQQRVTVLSRTEHGTPHKVLITLSIITEQRQAEALVATQRDLARLIATVTDPAIIWPRCLALAIQVCGMDSGGIYLFDAATQVLELVAHQGLAAEFVQATACYPVDAPNAQQLFAARPAYLGGAELRRREVFRCETLASVAIMPIHAQEHLLGCVNLGSHTLEEVPAFARPALETIATEIGNVVVALRTAATLREREELYRSLIDCQESAIAILDAAGVYHFINQIGAAPLALAPAAVVGRRLHDFFPPPIVTWQLEQLRQVIASGQGIVVEVQHALRGASRWYQTNIQPIRDALGTPVLAMVNSLDITEHKQTEEQLRALTQTLEARVAQRTAEVQDLYDHAPVGYHSLDSEGRIVRVNQTELDWLGYTREELIGRPLLELVVPASRARAAGAFVQLKAQGYVNGLEVDLLRKDGSTFPALFSATAVYDAMGSFVMTRSTLVDITERKQVEAALRESDERHRALVEQLRLSEARLQLLLAKTPAVIFSSLAEPDFRSTFVSESVRQVLGYTPAEFLSGPSFWASRIHPDDASRVFDDAPQLFAQGWRQYEYRCRHADGGYRWVETGVSLLPSVEGHPLEVVGYLIDITARKEIEELLRQANLELARASRLKDEFLANMSHELRTPLNAILGFSEGLQAAIYEPLTARQEAAIRHIETSGRHLLNLINDILDLSKVEAGQLTLTYEPFEIADVCTASLLFVKELAARKTLQLSFSQPESAAMIEADARRVKQMLVNLLSNAVKFTPEGGQVSLEVALDAAAGVVRFAVHDTGIGIAPAEQARLFQPFVQLDSSLSRQHEGTGLGLALVRRLAELHDGHVTLESEVGVGSCFTLILPLAAPILAAGTLALAAPAQASLAPRLPAALAEQPCEPVPGSAQILLVEDNEPNSQVVNDYLQASGFAVSIARNGRTALAVVMEQPPDLILMDIQLPELDGLTLIRRLRAMPSFAHTPIIALTALAMPGDQERCLAAGANAYLTKPIRFGELLENIRRLLQRGGDLVSG